MTFSALIRDNIKQHLCIVVGSSQGLGAALVSALFQSGAETIIGIARTPAEKIREIGAWNNMGTYRHLELDITSRNAALILEETIYAFPDAPLLVIFNAACLENDASADGIINFEILTRINQVGITGLAVTLQAVQSRIIKAGGIIVGISSINAIKPSVIDHIVAYPATKAYLAMALRSLAIVWRNKATVSVIHLGHIGGPEKSTGITKILNPSYRSTAEWIVNKISCKALPVETTYPLIYRVCYQYILKNIPDFLYVALLSGLLDIASGIRKWISPEDRQ